MSERLFYIWSLTHTKGEMTLWWMPDDRGYTTNLARAGKYTEAQIAANRRYYDNGRSTRAVPVETADAMSMRIVPNDRHELESRIDVAREMPKKAGGLA